MSGLSHETASRIRRHLGLYQNALEGVILIPIVSGKMLKVPLDLAGVGIQGERRICVEDVATLCVSLDRSPRNGHRHADIDQVKVRIVARGNPCGASAALLVWKSSPGFTSGLPLLWDRMRAPQLLTRLHVVGRDPATRVDVVAAGHSGDDLTVDDLGPAGVMVSDGPIPDLVLPYHVARTGVEGNQIGVVCGDEEMVAVQRGVAVDARQGCRVVDPLAAVLPDDRSVARVHRLDEVARLGQEHDTVVHQRGRLLLTRRHGPGPGQAERAHVRRVDLIERAVPPSVVGSAPHEPLTVRRAEQHVLGYGRVGVHERLGARKGGHTENTDEGGENTGGDGSSCESVPWNSDKRGHLTSLLV